MNKSEIAELYNVESTPLGKVPFLKDGCIINLDNSLLEVEQKRHWHIYTVKNYEIVGLLSLSDKDFKKLKDLLKDFLNGIGDK